MSNGITYSLLFDIDDWFEIEEQVLDALAQDSTRGSTWVKWGTVLLASGQVSEATYSEYKPQAGRRRASSRTSYSVSREQVLRRYLGATISFDIRSTYFDDWVDFQNDMECFTFSNLSSRQVADIAIVAHQYSHASCGEINLENRVHRGLLWHGLLWGAAVMESVTLLSAPDAVEDYTETPTGELAFNAPSSWESGPTRGYFEDTIVGFAIDARFAKLQLPPIPTMVMNEANDVSAARSVDSPTLSPPVTARTPAESVIANLPYDGVTRISRVDRPHERAHVKLPDIDGRYPDLASIIHKVRTYCLERSRPENKWVGFQYIGFNEDRAGDDVTLASLLSSALYQKFEPYEVRATSDGSIQFSVDIILPRRHSGFAAVVSSWYLSPTNGIRLSTAWEQGATSRAAALPLPVPVDLFASGHFDKFLQIVSERARNYGESVSSTQLVGSGWLWIPNKGRSANFASWLRKDNRYASETFTRSKLGGRVTQMTTGAGIVPFGLAVGELHYLQICLGIAGIQSFVETRLD